MQTIPLLVPHMPTAERVLPYLQEIDANRKYTNYGPLNERVEGKLTECVAGGRFVTTVSNCTVGLELALQAFGIGATDEILIPSITFVATATAVLRIAAVPVFADVDPDSWLLTPEIAEKAVAGRPIKAVIPVSTFGAPQDVAGWDAFTERTGIPVLIDAAGAFGNQSVGRTTDVVFSFHATKSFGAGEGGAILSGSEERILEIRRLANFGIDTSTSTLVGLGTNGKMSEYHCAVALAAFDMWDETMRSRIKLSRHYTGRLGEHCPTLVFQRKPDDGIYPLLPVLLPRGRSAATVSARLRENGIDTRRWYSPALYTHPALREYDRAGGTPVSDDVGERILGVPFFLGITDEQIDRVGHALQRALDA